MQGIEEQAFSATQTKQKRGNRGVKSQTLISKDLFLLLCIVSVPRPKGQRLMKQQHSQSPPHPSPHTLSFPSPSNNTLGSKPLEFRLLSRRLNLLSLRGSVCRYQSNDPALLSIRDSCLSRIAAEARKGRVRAIAILLPRQLDCRLDLVETWWLRRVIREPKSDGEREGKKRWGRVVRR